MTAASPGLDGDQALDKGKKIDPNSDGRQGLRRLSRRRSHDKALAKVGGAQKLYDYGFAFNGFAAVLTEGQAERLRRAEGRGRGHTRLDGPSPGHVHDPELPRVDCTPLLWAITRRRGQSGEDVVIGMLDAGFCPEHPSFTDQLLE